MRIDKIIAARRQAIRLHIDVMEITKHDLKDRAKRQCQDVLAYKTARKAALRLQDKIEEAKRELNILEENWHV